MYKKNLSLALLMATAGAEPRLIWRPQRPPEQFTKHYFAMISMTPECTNFFWSVIELKRDALGVSIANSWVRLSSYTKEDIRRSMAV